MGEIVSGGYMLTALMLMVLALALKQTPEGQITWHDDAVSLVYHNQSEGEVSERSNPEGPISRSRNQ